MYVYIYSVFCVRLIACYDKHLTFDTQSENSENWVDALTHNRVREQPQQ